MGKSVCVLEDDEAIREVIIMLLKDENYDVTGFASIHEFNQKSKNLKPDLFLLDVMLPDGSGVDICTGLKTSDQTKNIPVLMMSAHANAFEIKMNCEAQGFIPKPFDIDDLLNRVNYQVNLAS